MNEINSKNIIIAPVVTEKSLVAQAAGKYSFWVGLQASKTQIASAFKSIFNIEPLKVNTRIIAGKTKTNWKTRQPVQKSDRKKAVITVPRDTKLEMLSLGK